MQFTDLYDKLLQGQQVRIMNTNTGGHIFFGELSKLPHSIYEKICLADVERIYVFVQQDFNSYLVVEVYEE